MLTVFRSLMSSRRPRALCAALVATSLALLSIMGTARTAPSTGGPGLGATYAAASTARLLTPRLPALDAPFIENAGEVDRRVALYAATTSGTLFIAHDGELTYVLPGGTKDSPERSTRWVLKEHLVGAHKLHVSGVERTSMTVRHMGTATQGDDLTGSAARQATFRWADLGEAWPGVTVRIRASDARAEQYFRVAPGADAAQMRLRVDGAQHLSTNARGELEVATGVGTAVFSTPVAWQEIDGQRQPVAVRYALRGTREYGFLLGRHDLARAVVIDPLLQSTYIGGSGGSAPTDGVADLAIEPSTGDVYVVGYTASTTGFPVSAGALQTTHAAQIAVFVARLPADLKSFTEVTYLGGTKNSFGNTIAISPLTRDIYVAGTSEGNFPGSTGGAFTACGSSVCAFISRMDSTLSTLRQTTTYGDNVDSNYPVRLALDATSGDVYLEGSSTSAALQGTAGGAQPIHTGTGFGTPSAGFVARFAADLKTLLQATYIEGSTGNQYLRGLGIDPASGDIFVAGWSTSASLPASAGAFQTTPDPNGGDTGFVARLPKTLRSFVALSYLSAANSNGGSGTTGGKSNAPITWAEALALHPTNGDLYVSGTTFQGNALPASTGGYQSTFPVGDNAQFVVRLAPDLSAVRQSTFLIDLNNSSTATGGNNLIRIPASGDVFVLGEACPGTAGGIQSTLPLGGPNGVPCLSRLTPDLHSLVQSTYLSGSGPNGNGFLFADSIVYATMAIRDSNGDVYVGGATQQIDFPGTAGGAEPVAPGATSRGVISGYITRLSGDLAALPAGSLQFSAAIYTAADTSGNAAITVTRIGGSAGAVSVSFATSDGAGKAGTDYTTTTQTVSFAAGDAAAKTVSVPVKVNGAVAGNETVNLTLSGPTGGATLGSPVTAVLTITQTTAPAAGTLQFSAATYTAADTSGNAAITVTRTGGSNGAVSVSFATSDGTGKAGTDYTTTTQTVSFAAGDTAAKTVSVPVKVDSSVAGNETVNLTLSNAAGGATLGSPATAVLTITQTTAPALPTTMPVTVVGKGGGGATGPFELVLLGLLALARLIRRRSEQPATRANPALRIAALRTAIVLAGALGASASAIADSPYYVGASAGQTRSEANSADLTRKLTAAGFPDATVALDEHGLGGRIFLGRSFGDHFAIEGAYVDLGTVRSHSSIVTAPSNEAGFVQAVADAHPYSARGIDVTAVAGFKPIPRLSLYARAGGLAWRGKIDASLAGLNAVSTRKDGVSGVLGAGLGVDLTSHLTLRIEWERYFLSRYSVDLPSLGVRFGF